MNGQDVFKFAVRAVPSVSLLLLHPDTYVGLHACCCTYTLAFVRIWQLELCMLQHYHDKYA